MSLWTDRDEPVLRSLVENPPFGNILSTNQHSDQPDSRLPQLTQAQFHRAVLTLHDAGYLASDGGTPEGGGGVHFCQFLVTGEGKQALGLWPRFDALGSPGELASILESLAETAPTEEEASNLKRAARAVRRAAPGVIRGLAEAGLGAAARHLLGV
jgi:hypothetical protein